MRSKASSSATKRASSRRPLSARGTWRSRSGSLRSSACPPAQQLRHGTVVRMRVYDVRTGNLQVGDEVRAGDEVIYGVEAGVDVGSTLQWVAQPTRQQALACEQ